MSARTAVETIQAAIDKLEALRTESVPGPWELEPLAENFNPRWDVARILHAAEHPGDRYYDRYVHVDGSYAIDVGGFKLPDARLIVTLHRTIDAQLKAFSSALWLINKDPLASGHAATYAIIGLALAILGEES